MHAQVILFDQGHGQRFLIEGSKDLDLTQFAQLFAASGDVVTARREPITPQLLKGIDILIISGAFSPYIDEELGAIQRFVLSGGRLCIMFHVAPVNDGLLRAFNLRSSRGVIHENKNTIGGLATDFSTTRIASAHPLFKGVSAINFYGSWAVSSLTPGVEELAWSSPTAWLDINRNKLQDNDEPVSEWPLILTARFGQGTYTVFGDDAVFQNRFLSGDNLLFAKNLVTWLKTPFRKESGYMAEIDAASLSSYRR